MEFIKRGRAAQEQARKHDKQQEKRKAMRGAGFRFRCPDGEEKKITFLDGKLTPEGVLERNQFYEHQVKINGKYGNFFPCVSDKEQCPLCERNAKGEYKALVNMFTVIDHSKWRDGNGKLHKNEKRLFAAKSETVARLQKKASKLGGLIGCTFTVSRSGEMSPSVGSDFEFEEKLSLKEIRLKYKLNPDDTKPIDYDATIKYFTAEELCDLIPGLEMIESVGSHDTKKRKLVEDEDAEDDDNDSDSEDDEQPKASKKKRVIVEDEIDDDEDEDEDSDDDEEDDDEDDDTSDSSDDDEDEDEESDDDDDDEDEDDEEDDDPPPPPKKKKAAPVKKAKKTAKKKKAQVDAEDEDDDVPF